jgi:hypothetical protein
LNGVKERDLHRYPAGVPVRGNGGEDDKLDCVQLDGVKWRIGLASAAVQLRLDVLHVGILLLHLQSDMNCWELYFPIQKTINLSISKI